MRTTSSHAAITALLTSQERDPVLSVNEDGLFHIHASERAPDNGAFVVLTPQQSLQVYDVTAWIARGKTLEELHESLADVLKAEWEGWFRSARYNASLTTTSSDTAHHTSK